MLIAIPRKSTKGMLPMPLGANRLRSEPRSLPINEWYTQNLVAQNFTVILPQKKRPIVS